MSLLKRVFALGLCAFFGLFAVQAEAGGGSYGRNQDKAASDETIVQIAVANPQFSTLVSALKAADLVGALSQPGPFTVFAPTDDAFAKLPKGTLQNLLKPENVDQLKAVLTYHVVPGKVLSGDLKNMKVKTLNGQDLTIEVKNGEVTVNGVKVVQPDIEASNGVIHVIDGVLIPQSS